MHACYLLMRACVSRMWLAARWLQKQMWTEYELLLLCNRVCVSETNVLRLTPYVDTKC